ncbi:MAG TPA: hypothetical protein VMG60_04750 [Burkholderiaceae bacterium]|nr:hypothetical protein [Burkholderiaceae bacterium]
MTGARSLEQALADSPAAALVHRAAESQRVAVALAGAGVSLPPNFDALQPGTCEVRDATLVLFVGSPALAAKMRQSLPQLLAFLNRQGFDLTEIKLRLQPERLSYREPSGEETMKRDARGEFADSRQAAPDAASALGLAEKLALTLPDSGVGRAAQRLADRLRARVAQTR